MNMRKCTLTITSKMEKRQHNNSIVINKELIKITDHANLILYIKSKLNLKIIKGKRARKNFTCSKSTAHD